MDDQQQIGVPMPGLMYQPPEEVHRTGGVGPSTTVKTVQETPQVQAALQDEANANAAEQTAQGAELSAMDRAQGFKNQQTELEATAEATRAAHANMLAVERENKRAREQQYVTGKLAERDEAIKQMEANAHPTSYWEDRSAPARIVSAFLVGLGTAAGDQGQAYGILKDQMAQDRERKLQKYTASKEFVELKNRDVEAAQAALKAHEEQWDREDVAKTNVLEKQLAAITKRTGIPAAQAQFEATKAAKEQDHAQKRAAAAQKQAAEFQRYEVTNEANSGHSSWDTTVNVNKGAQSGKTTREERKDAVDAEIQARNMAKLQDLINKHPDAYKEWQDAYRAQQELDSGSQSGGGKFLRSLGDFTGYTPPGIDRRLKSPEAREINSLMAPLKTAKARELDPVGALNEGAINIGEKHLNLASAPAGEIVNSAKGYEQNFRAKAAAAMPQAAQQQSAASMPAPRSREAKEYVQQARQWLDSHPKAPKEQRDGIKARIRALSGN